MLRNWISGLPSTRHFPTAIQLFTDNLLRQKDTVPSQESNRMSFTS